MSSRRLTFTEATPPETAQARLYAATNGRGVDRVQIDVHGFSTADLSAVLDTLGYGWQIESAAPSRVVLTATAADAGRAPAAAAPEARSGVASMGRFVTSNIKGTPLMSLPSVKHDVHAVLTHADVAGFQEIGSNRGSRPYKGVLRRQAARMGFNVAHLNTENPIAYNSAMYEEVAGRGGVKKLSDGRPGTPKRTATWVELRERHTGKLVTVLNTHWVQQPERGGWNKALNAQDKRETGELIDQLEAQGRTIIAMGDLNNPHGGADFSAGSIVKGGIDHVALINNRHGATVHGRAIRIKARRHGGKLRTDHDAIGREVRL